VKKEGLKERERERERERETEREKTTTALPEKYCISLSEQRDKGWIHIIR